VIKKEELAPYIQAEMKV